MKVIMWDVDDVLNDLMGEWFRSSWRKTYPECSLEYSMITSNPPHEILGVTKEEYLESLDAFRKNYFKDLKPLPEMQRWFSLHGHKARHVVITSVPIRSASHSAEWVFTHFGRWIHSFNIVPSLRPDDPPDLCGTNKADYLRATFSKVDVVVEDNPCNIDSMKRLGIDTVTIPRPWNGVRGTIGEALTELTGLIAGNNSRFR
jgi:5'(3')-deoxyribonucleotidase